MDSPSGRSTCSLKICSSPKKAKLSPAYRKRKPVHLKLNFDSIVNDNAVDTPQSMKTVTSSDGQPDPHYLGQLVYACVKTWQGSKRIDLRTYECCDRKHQLYPTKNGIALDLQEWVHIDYCKSDIEHEIERVKQQAGYVGVMTIGRSNFIKIYRSSHNSRVYIDIRFYILCDAKGETVPSRKGVKLSLSQWKKLKDINFSDDVPELSDMKPCWYEQSHQNQEYRCAYCAKDTSGVRNAPEYSAYAPSKNK
ncbi:uncharacterized protein LOC141905512 [Tubulanus polymorphus]|uniref:uncharacterized protein LOC141905512 n=1 Tax=Tubulanus polymorphus TaxID=672921 RepID=UPI003DA584C2